MTCFRYVIFLIIFLLDDRIKTDDENLERYLGLSVLGNIPNADGKKPGKYGYYKTYASGIFSEKTGKTYDAYIVLEDDGTKTAYRLEFERGKANGRQYS